MKYLYSHGQPDLQFSIRDTQLLCEIFGNVSRNETPIWSYWIGGPEFSFLGEIPHL